MRTMRLRYVCACDRMKSLVATRAAARHGPTADIETLLDRLDGIILTGAAQRSADLYDGPPHAEGTTRGSGA